MSYFKRFPKLVYDFNREGVVNSVIDALSDFGVKDLQMPLAPQNVWAAMQKSN